MLLSQKVGHARANSVVITDEVIRRKVPIRFNLFFFSRKRVKPSWYFLVIWPYRESKFFFIQSVITKVEIIPLFHGYSIYLFEPFVKEKNDGPLIVRPPFFFLCNFRE